MIRDTDCEAPRIYPTRGGIEVSVTRETIDGALEIERLIDALDAERGALFVSSTEIPGRYTRWDRGFRNPPLVVEAQDRSLRVEALNERGRVLLPAIEARLASVPECSILPHATPSSDMVLQVRIEAASGSFSEEDRSRQPSVFSALRALVHLFSSPVDPELGLYGAFGYDLAFQFEPIRMHHVRDAAQRDLVLYLPDELVVVDHRKESAHRFRYEFVALGRSTEGLPRTGKRGVYVPGTLARGSDHEDGAYAQVVRRARRAFARGDLFEVVPSQVFSEGCPAPPSELFRRLRARNPSPYGFVMNLGADEYLVGASPEMYVRVTPGSGDAKGRLRVETCPIAGTIERGADALEDASQIRKLLVSRKDECELTMCTDVDRNDKGRVCEPGSVRVIARRQIELYSRLIHTVDHVEGTLLPERDALDAFLAHTWAVTVTGAPKAAAMRFIEEHELSARRWYGGAVGSIGFDGSLNTGLVLRTVRLAEGNAEVRVGATLLYDSDPEAEEAETRLKASALLDALRRPTEIAKPRRAPSLTGALVADKSERKPDHKRVLLVDAQDSFVHTLGSYFRQAGAVVKTLRAGFPADDLSRYEPDLVVLSPGPGRPADFGLAKVIEAALAQELPLFGVCLGLQAIAEFFGGELGVLPEPVHGKASEIRVSRQSQLLEGLPERFLAGRYHSLHAIRDRLPDALRVVAVDDAGVVMALEHRELPISAVQFHPESILSATGGLGFRLIQNVLGALPVRIRTRVSTDVLPV